MLFLVRDYVINPIARLLGWEIHSTTATPSDPMALLEGGGTLGESAEPPQAPGADFLFSSGLRLSDKDYEDLPPLTLPADRHDLGDDHEARINAYIDHLDNFDPPTTTSLDDYNRAAQLYECYFEIFANSYDPVPNFANLDKSTRASMQIVVVDIQEGKGKFIEIVSLRMRQQLIAAANTITTLANRGTIKNFDNTVREFIQYLHVYASKLEQCDKEGYHLYELHNISRQFIQFRARYDIDESPVPSN